MPEHKAVRADDLKTAAEVTAGEIVDLKNRVLHLEEAHAALLGWIDSRAAETARAEPLSLEDLLALRKLIADFNAKRPT